MRHLDPAVITSGRLIALAAIIAVALLILDRFEGPGKRR